HFRHMTKARFAFNKRFLVALLLGDVLLDRQIMRDFATRVAQRRYGLLRPVGFPVFLSILDFAAPLAAAQDRFPKAFVLIESSVIRAQQTGSPANEFAGGVARQSRETIVHIFDDASPVGNKDRRGALIHRER